MLGQVMPTIISMLSSGTLRIWKIPACVTSTKNTVLSSIFEVTVTLIATSKTPSSNI